MLDCMTGQIPGGCAGDRSAQMTMPICGPHNLVTQSGDMLNPTQSCSTF